MYQNPLHTRGYISGVLRGKPPLSLAWMLMRTSKWFPAAILFLFTSSQFNDLLKSVYDRLVSAWLFPWFPSHWKWIPSPYHCMQGVIFTCLHTHSSPNPLPSSSLTSNVSVKLLPQDLCTCCLLCLQSPADSEFVSSRALLKSFWLSEAPGVPYLKLPPHIPYPLSVLSPCHLLYTLLPIFFGVGFPL